MALFRDLSNVSVHGISGDPGCQGVSLECQADEIVHSSCDEDFISYLGLINQTMTATATFAGGPDQLRDIGAMSFAGTDLKNALTAELAEISEEIPGGDDGDCWLTYVGVTKRQVEVTATFRDVLEGMSINKGDQGDFSVVARAGIGADPCASPISGTTFAATGLTVTGFSCEATHGALAEFSLTLKSSSGGDSIFTGSVLPTEVVLGNCGPLIWTKNTVAAGTNCVGDKAFGGGDIPFTLSPTVATERRVSLAHSEMTTESITLRAYSTDGVTSPLS